MVTVSNLLGNYPQVSSHRRITAQNNFKADKKESKEEKNVNHNLKYYKTIKEDELVEKNTLGKRIALNIKKTMDIPFLHFPRGLGGAPSFTFFEFLQTAKFPFYVGGPVLAALFYAGVKKDNMKAAGAAQKVAKHMALGVGLYYVGAGLARFIINKTVKAARGFDLNQPYAKAVPGGVNLTGAFKKSVEFHKAYESADFTRWDLLYDKEKKNANEINRRYLEIAPKYGIKKETNDVDSTLKPLMKKTIIMARAWQYALTAFYVTLGIGMANQKVWEKAPTGGFKHLLKDGILNKQLDKQSRLHNAKLLVYDNIIKPFGESFIQFWKGTNKATSIAGKTTIIAAGVATLTALAMLLSKTTGRHHKIVSFGSNNKNDEVKQ